MESLVKIFDEEGVEGDGSYEIVSDSTGAKNVFRIKGENGKERLIHKDRIIFDCGHEGNEKMTEELGKENEEAKNEGVKNEGVKTKKTKKKKKKPLIEFDLGVIDNMGVLYHRSSTTAIDTGVSKIKVDSYCIVTKDAKKWQHFNLYNGSLGKKARPPEESNFESIKDEISGNVEAIEKYLEKKRYSKE